MAKGMKLTTYDRLIAIIRSPLYNQEYSELGRSQKADTLSQDTKRMCKQWGLWYLPEPKHYHFHPKSDADFYLGSPSVEKIDINVTDLISKEYPQLELKEVKPDSDLHSIIIDMYRKKSDRRIGRKSQAKRLERRLDDSNLSDDILRPFMPQYLYEKGKYLYLKVDLTRDKKDIEKQFNDIVCSYKKYMPKDNSRKSDPAINRWVVYDMRWYYGYNFSKIARKLSGLNGNPSETGNEKLMAYFKQIKRAYNKACEMIKHVEKEAEQNNSL